MLVYNKGFTISRVSCGQCSLTRDVLVKPGSAIGADYSFFLDLYIADQDLQRLGKRVADFTKASDKEGLILYYSILRARCETKASEALKVKGDVNLTLVHMWEYKAIECNRRLESLRGEKFKVPPVSVISYRRDRRGYFLPYPYIFKPPSPPDDIGLATNVQRTRPVEAESPCVELFCLYCGSKLSMDESFCSVCGKKS